MEMPVLKKYAWRILSSYIFDDMPIVNTKIDPRTVVTGNYFENDFSSISNGKPLARCVSNLVLLSQNAHLSYLAAPLYSEFGSRSLAWMIKNKPLGEFSFELGMTEAFTVIIHIDLLPR